MALVAHHSALLPFLKARLQTLLFLKLEAAIRVAPAAPAPAASPAAALQALPLLPPQQPPLLLQRHLTAQPAQPAQPLLQARRHLLQAAPPRLLIRPLTPPLMPRLLHRQPHPRRLATVTHHMFSWKHPLAEAAAPRLRPVVPRLHLPPAHPLPHRQCRQAR